MPGGTYNPSTGNSYGNSYGGGLYGNRNPYETGQVNGPYPGSGFGGMGGGFGGIGGGFGGMGLPNDYEGKKSLILPLAGAALLG